MTDLHVLVGDQETGVLSRGRGGALTFEYSDSYRSRPDATPLSVSMPLAAVRHLDATVKPWLWGLLPDNTQVIDRWARTFQVSASSPFALLSTPVGEDCAGAVRFARPERVTQVRGRSGQVEWLDDAAIAGRLRDLRSDATTWLGKDVGGHFSLAGAQAKTALLHRHGRWGVPSGNQATSHILKPAIIGRDDHDLNEHTCLRAAAACGMPAAVSRIARFEDQQVIVVERFDRIASSRRGDPPVRVHQEDLCQALGVHPRDKYQAEGGPTPQAIGKLIRRVMPPASAETDVRRFTDALIFNWLIGGTDAHAKNYALLLSGSRVRLAPLYDIGSALPYPDLHVRKLRLAMKFGGSYDLLPRTTSVWPKLAADVGLPLDVVVQRARFLTERVPDAFASAGAEAAVAELGSDLPARLLDAVSQRVRQCAAALP